MAHIHLAPDGLGIRDAILWCIDRHGGGGTWTPVIANMLNMQAYFSRPFKVNTADVRRELRRMERDGVVISAPTCSRLYLAWRRA